MKSKKGLFIGVGIMVIVVIATTLLIFLHKTSDAEMTVSINLNGSWKVISKLGEYVEDEVLVFHDGTFEDFRDGATNPAAESSYTLKNDRLELKDLSKVYYIAEKTENYLIFVDDSDKTEWRVIKAPINQITKDWLIGNWNVIMHGDTLTTNETVTFETDTLKIFKDDASEPAVSSQYTWKNDETIYVDALNMEVYLYSVNDNTLIMRQAQDGYVWELTKS